MKIKQLIPVTSDYAVLATRKTDFADPCYDQQDSGHSFFWAVMDEGYKDTIALIDVDVNGNHRICERRLVVPRKACPFCSQQMEPVYDNKHTPDFWQECPACGYVHDMRCHDEQEGGENDEFFTVLESTDHDELLLSSITPFGKRVVNHYREWLQELQASDVNLDIQWNDSLAASRRIHVLAEKAPKIISILDTIDSVDDREVELTGKLTGINIRNLSFEMVVDGQHKKTSTTFIPVLVL